MRSIACVVGVSVWLHLRLKLLYMSTLGAVSAIIRAITVGTNMQLQNLKSRLNPYQTQSLTNIHGGKFLQAIFWF